MEVQQAGGGIHFTVEKTKEASEDELLELLLDRLDRMLRAGTQPMVLQELWIRVPVNTQVIVL